MPSSLVQSLFDGPLDIVGDVHGEIDALRSLMRHLGYAVDGTHPDEKRLVFVGDLTDRGPDSPAVIDLVKSLVDAGRAQCVLGNHDLNILLGEHKHDNRWFFGEKWSLDRSGETPFESSGKLRYEERVSWWEEYTANPICVFGHYSNYRGETSLSSRAICVDFAVAKRWQERKQPSFAGAFRGSLAAVRFPEGCVVFDNGDIEHLERP